MHDHLDHSVMATVISSQHRSLSRFSGASKSVVGLVLMKSWLFFSIGRIHVASQEYFVRSRASPPCVDADEIERGDLRNRKSTILVISSCEYRLVRDVVDH